MLSKREKEIIEIEGFIELAEEIFEETLLRATIEDLEVLKERLQILKKG